MTGLALAALKGIAGLFGVSPFLIGAITAGVLALGAGGTAIVWHHKIYRSGYDAAIAAVARDDHEAVGRAITLRHGLQDCEAKNGRWDQTTGECE